MVGQLFNEYEPHLNLDASIDSRVDYLLNRLNLFCDSLDFNLVLDLPPDRMLRLLFVNLHVWLICDRLNQSDLFFSKNCIKSLIFKFQRFIENYINSIDYKKTDHLIRDYKKKTEFFMNLLDGHFNRKQLDDPRVQLDDLVWEFLLAKKVFRFDWRISFLAEYIASTYEYVQTLSFDDIMNGRFVLTPHWVDADFHSKIRELSTISENEDFDESLSRYSLD